MEEGSPFSVITVPKGVFMVLIMWKKRDMGVSEPGRVCILAYTARTNRDVDEKSPGRPIAPIPREYRESGVLGASLFLGASGESAI